jgi:hypothetical protein
LSQVNTTAPKLEASRHALATLLLLLSADPGPFKPGSFFVEPNLELVLGRQLELVARHEHIPVACGRETHNLRVTFCAEQNPNRWILLRIGNMLGQMIDVEAKLPGMLRLKRSHFEIDGDETAQPTMKEKQIDVMMAIPRGDAKLPGDEAEIATEFEEKLLKMIDERALQGIRPKRRPAQASKPHRACH